MFVVSGMSYNFDEIAAVVAPVCGDLNTSSALEHA